MKLLIDVNLSPKWVDFLIAEGFEATHWSALGSANAPDREIIEVALREGWVVLTNDLDFSAVLAWTGASGPSVVQIRGSALTVDAIGATLASALRMAAADIARGALVTLDPLRTRIRVLPLVPPA